MSATLALGATLGLAGGALFGAAALRTFRRAARVEAPQLRAFGVFWLGAGAYVGVDALWSVSWLLDFHTLPLGIAVLQLKVAAACASFAGLLVYLFTIYTGRAHVNVVVGTSYLALFLTLGTYYMWRSPVGAHAGLASLGLDYARAAPALVWNGLVVLLFLPPIVAALAYASLLRVAGDPTARRRILLMSAGLLLFFAPQLLGWIVGTWWWGLAERALALSAGGLVLLATVDTRERAVASQADAALAARARELI